MDIMKGIIICQGLVFYGGVDKKFLEFHHNSMKRDQDLTKAFEVGVEVRRAEHGDIKEVGIHLLDPSIAEVLDAIVSAMRLGVDLVLIHSKNTWRLEK